MNYCGEVNNTSECAAKLQTYGVKDNDKFYNVILKGTFLFRNSGIRIGYIRGGLKVVIWPSRHGNGYSNCIRDA
jgi:hypothetical protein